MRLLRLEVLKNLAVPVDCLVVSYLEGEREGGAERGGRGGADSCSHYQIFIYRRLCALSRYLACFRDLVTRWLVLVV